MVSQIAVTNNNC